MEYTHAATGLHPLDFVRVDVSWTPSKEGVDVGLRDGGSLIQVGAYRSPRLAVLPLDPDPDTLHSAVRLILSGVRGESWHADYAYRLTSRKGLTWVPERLGR